MSVHAAALRARRTAESLMSSTCTVFASGAEVTDPNTGEVTHEQDVIWFGPCRVRSGSNQSTSTVNLPGVESFTFDYVIAVPFAVSTVIEGHRVTVTDSPDPALVGITVEVQKVHRHENGTARRLFCREVV